MPFSANRELPKRVKENIPSERGKTIFRNAFNNAFESGKSESVSFATAWGALENAGFEQNDNKKWVKKSLPDAGDVHVPSTQREHEKAEGFAPPKAAQDNAKKVLRWREEYPDEIQGMTEVGWRRARQLASGDPISLDTVKRISQFARHKENAKINEEHKGEPWKDAGYVAWLGWGGDEAILNWAPKVIERQETKKRYFHDDAFTTLPEAQARSHDLGFNGATHIYQSDDGQLLYMPGETHEQYLGRAEQKEEEKPESLLSLVRELRELLHGDKHPTQTYGNIFKVDEEQRIVYGWASVISENGEPVVDTQGDSISSEELEKAVNEFMEDDRVGKVMHDGDQTGMILHSFPLTKDVASALGIETEREGWIVGYKVNDDEVWKRVKKGDFSGFSIGGSAHRINVDE